ncbi:MAG TPA: class I SAM-dependent methyltransferase [Candidatus Eisenbacteria bacterium]|nr:class I SAM-dependent methyltransferase [Candidatus Eisenbacteria bacterium]
MKKKFNYEDVFMGVPDLKKGFKRSFVDDYRLKRLTDFLKMRKGKLLDIGSGGGITTESFSYYYPGIKIYGCDVSKQAITYAKKLGSGKVTYAVIRNKKLPYKNNTFDAITCMDVLEHIPDVDFFMKEVKRILKKNGKFFLLVPTEGQQFTHTWFWQKIGIGKTMTFRRYGHIHPEFTHEYIAELLKKYNFKISKRAYSEHALFQLITLFTYFFPMEVMEFFLGKKANKYSDREVVKANLQGKKDFDILMQFRNFWWFIINNTRRMTLWELDLLKGIPMTAWKSITLSTNIK